MVLTRIDELVWQKHFYLLTDWQTIQSNYGYQIILEMCPPDTDASASNRHSRTQNSFWEQQKSGDSHNRLKHIHAHLYALFHKNTALSTLYLAQLFNIYVLSQYKTVFAQESMGYHMVQCQSFLTCPTRHRDCYPLAPGDGMVGLVSHEGVLCNFCISCSRGFNLLLGFSCKLLRSSLLELFFTSVSLLFGVSGLKSLTEFPVSTNWGEELLNLLPRSISSDGVCSVENEQKKLSSFSRLSEGLVSVCQVIMPWMSSFCHILPLPVLNALTAILSLNSISSSDLSNVFNWLSSVYESEDCCLTGWRGWIKQLCGLSVVDSVRRTLLLLFTFSVTETSAVMLKWSVAMSGFLCNGISWGGESFWQVL